MKSQLDWKFSKLNNFTAWHCSGKNLVQQWKKKVFLWLTQHRWSFSFVSRGRCFLVVFELFRNVVEDRISNTHKYKHVQLQSDLQSMGEWCHEGGYSLKSSMPQEQDWNNCCIPTETKDNPASWKTSLEQKPTWPQSALPPSYLVIITVKINRILMQESRKMIQKQ